MKQYTDRDIAKAELDIKNSVRSTAQASKRYNIPQSTLRSRLNGIHHNMKKKYSDENVTKAVLDIQNKVLSVSGASKKYLIPRTTLSDRLKGVHTKSYGASKVLSNEQETKLVECIILCAESGYPMSRSQILRTAEKLSNLNADKKFSKAKPTTGWFQCFCKRHPGVKESSIRKQGNLFKAKESNARQLKSASERCVVEDVNRTTTATTDKEKTEELN